VEEEERKEAVAWLKKAARQGHEGARKFLGVLKEEIPDVKKGKKAAPAKTPAGHP
jgi:TPR repeat protein